MLKEKKDFAIIKDNGYQVEYKTRQLSNNMIQIYAIEICPGGNTLEQIIMTIDIDENEIDITSTYFFNEKFNLKNILHNGVKL
jgi:hypothetical protein